MTRIKYKKTFSCILFLSSSGSVSAITMCDLCKRYAKTPARPIVGMPMATQFNEKVAMDLKQWNGRWILHIIDMWSRYTISVFIELLYVHHCCK